MGPYLRRLFGGFVMRELLEEMMAALRAVQKVGLGERNYESENRRLDEVDAQIAKALSKAQAILGLVEENSVSQSQPKSTLHAAHTEAEPSVREDLEDLAVLPDALKIAVRHHVREMYPKAAEAGGPSFILSIGNCASNVAHAVVMRVLNAEAARLPDSLSTTQDDPNPTSGEVKA
jgi:hypothetical protein